MWESILPAIISGGASLLGGFMSNEASARSADRNMVFQDAQARIQRNFQSGMAHQAMGFSGRQAAKQRDFQQMMSSTAHRREISDLRKAGLNPILSGTGGMGSASAAGAAGSGVSAPGAAGHGAQYEARDIASPAVNSALHARRLTQELKGMEEQRELMDQQNKTEIARQTELYSLASLHDRDLGLRDAQIRKLGQERETEANRTLTEFANARRMLAEADLAHYSLNAARAESDIDASDYGVGLRWTRRAVDQAQGATSALRNVLPIPRGRDRGPIRRYGSEY